MDPELIAYLDERFRGLDASFTQQIQGLREETSLQIQGLREETSQQIQGLREETSQQIQGLREETSQRFDTVDKRLGQMDEQLRLTDVKVEALQGNIQVVAEGVAAVDEKLKDFRETVHLEFRDNKIQTTLFLKNMSERVRALELRAGRPEV